MDYNSDDSYEAFPLEPMILINDGEEEDIKLNEINEEAHLEPNKTAVPDISIIPLKRNKPLFKIRLFDKKSSAKRKDEDRPSVERNSVQIISKEEAEHNLESYQRRKSLPLEQCPICKKYFKRMATHLLKHEDMDANTQNSGLICNFCNKSFITQSNLLIHLRTHTGLKPYVCEICSKAFSQSCNLVNHMRIHSGERPFKCPHCDKAFTQSGNLNNHIRLHTNEKPFKCHFCDKAFVQSGNLNSHIKNNHRYLRQQGITDSEHSLSESALNNTV